MIIQAFHEPGTIDALSGTQTIKPVNRFSTIPNPLKLERAYNDLQSTKKIENAIHAGPP